VGREYKSCNKGSIKPLSAFGEALRKKSRKILKENKYVYHLCG